MVAKPPTQNRSADASGDDRGQAHTLEGLAAGMLLLASIVFALQVTAVTPLTGSTSSQHIENQQAAITEGLLASEAENGTLKPTLLYWNESQSRFYNSTDRGYSAGGPPTVFGHVLNQTLRDRGIAFNVNLYHIRADGNRQAVRLVYLGAPSDHASVASRTVTLYDDDRIRAANHSVTNKTLTDIEYFTRDIAPNGRLYNVIEIEVVIWRM